MDGARTILKIEQWCSAFFCGSLFICFLDTEHFDESLKYGWN